MFFHCCPVNKFFITIFLDSIYIYKIKSNIKKNKALSLIVISDWCKKLNTMVRKCFACSIKEKKHSPWLLKIDLRLTSRPQCYYKFIWCLQLSHVILLLKINKLTKHFLRARQEYFVTHKTSNISFSHYIRNHWFFFLFFFQLQL